MKVLNVANYIVNKYQEIFNDTVDEMKLHKLLYFAQKENIAKFNVPLFEDEMQGWKYGPVSPDVRKHMYELNKYSIDILSDDDKRIINSIILQYGPVDSIELSKISHKESSWKNSRIGLNDNDNGNKILSIDDIRKDAIRDINVFADSVSLDIKKVLDQAEEECKNNECSEFVFK